MNAERAGESGSTAIISYADDGQDTHGKDTEMDSDA